MNAEKDVAVDGRAYVDNRLDEIAQHIRDNEAERIRLQEEIWELEDERDRLANVDTLRIPAMVRVVFRNVDRDPVIAELIAEAKRAAGDWDALRGIKRRYDERTALLLGERERRAIDAAVQTAIAA